MQTKARFNVNVYFTSSHTAPKRSLTNTPPRHLCSFSMNKILYFISPLKARLPVWTVTGSLMTASTFFSLCAAAAAASLMN